MPGLDGLIGLFNLNDSMIHASSLRCELPLFVHFPVQPHAVTCCNTEVAAGDLSQMG